ncbi:MAG TPA: CRISPR-associated protein Cas4 [Phycisphaerae bacterium]|nr:CRISPR-associated protein Cas4 [Phycisphaerae bacterium]HOI56067.1 CRISPR-associated protein Cas4 [Phycisphaerae bacterium]
MFNEDDLLPISALQHLLFCPRQCALIHIEGLWSENRLTAEGRQLHQRTHEPRAAEMRGAVLITRSLPLRSLRLGLSGIADVVEFHQANGDTGQPNVASACADGQTPDAVALANRPGRWRPFPVEYKRGRPKAGDFDRVQLCAQALCLEEMLGVAIAAGALFYGRTRRRKDVLFDAALRARTEQAAADLRSLVASRQTPQAAREPKCKSCSLYDQCLPELAAGRRSALRYTAHAIEQSLTQRPGEEADP